ncbi:MAG TPA: hypothetical protein DCY94_01590 [Firmicutes bacterium]|nr:hypothetical protein [Bacillota bacterium]
MLNGLFTSANFLIDGLKNISFLLDKAIYSLVQAAYGVFDFLANATILNDSAVKIFTSRVYTLLGIIMVFVLAFNLLNYIIDPDKLSDKKIGATAFVKDVVIALAVISITPMLFSKLYALQTEILDSGVIVNLILGGQTMGEGRDVAETVDNGANIIVASVYSAFLYPENGDFTVLDCGTEKEKEMNYVDYCNAYRSIQEGKGGLGEFGSFITNEKYNYSAFLTTAAGIVLLFFMLSFCLNLAKRVGKMAVVQLIAPIPVTLELLPNKKGLRKTWFSTLIKTYLEVFFFLGVMYIIVFLISLVPGVISTIFSEATGGGLNLVKLIGTVILIYGLLMFGKEAPKMIFELLGIKETGVISEAMKRAIAIGGWSGLTASSVVGNAAKNYNASGGGIKGISSAIGGASSTLARNIWGSRNVHNLKDATKLRKDVNKAVIQARVNRDAYAHAHGDTFGGVLKGHVQDLGRAANLGTRSYFGADNKYQTKKKTEQVLQDYKKLYSDNVESIWKNDSKWSAYNAELLKAEAIGDTAAASNAKAKLEQRRLQVIQDKKLQFMEAAGKVNNFIDAHQGVDGIMSGHIDLKSIANISDDISAGKVLENITENVTGKKLDGKTVVGSGFATELDKLKTDTPYQMERVQDKLREDAKEATRKAADQASNKDDKK